MTSGPVCRTRDRISKSNKTVADRIKKQISDYKNDLVASGRKGLEDMSKFRARSAKELKDTKDNIANTYLGMRWRRKRPDVTLLAEIMLVVFLAIILYYVWPYITGSAKPGFSKAQFLRATKIPETAFSIEELAKVNLEVKALHDYAGFFKSDPYSMTNSGVYDLMVSTAIFPLVMFFIQFVLPPFVVGYIVWFIIRFWPYVIRAAWGWFIAMYRYFTRLIQGKLGCKWYIRMVTGWSCNSPNFYQYFVTWRRRYIDMPIYYEKLRYIQKYYWAKRVYYEIPYRKYITLPYKRYKVKAKFAKRVYVDRSIEVFLKKLRDMYPQYYTMPRDEFYKWLLSNNKHLAGTYAKAMQAKAQIEGRPYRSITEQGKQCTCPATKTPLRALKKSLQKQKERGADDLDNLIKVTNKIYDKANAISDAVDPDCGKVDTVIKHRKSIAGTVLICIVVTLIALYMYSAYFGTPVWLKLITVPAGQYVSQGTSLVLRGKLYYSIPLLYLGLSIITLGAVMYF